MLLVYSMYILIKLIRRGRNGDALNEECFFVWRSCVPGRFIKSMYIVPLMSMAKNGGSLCRHFAKKLKDIKIFFYAGY